MKSFRERTDDFQRQIIRGALRRAHGNQSAAARELGLPLPTFVYQAGRLGITPPAFRPSGSREDVAQRIRKQQALAQGLCANCFHRKAGVKYGGTLTACQDCAIAKRIAARKRAERKRLYAKSTVSATPELDQAKSLLVRDRKYTKTEQILALTARLSQLDRQRAGQRCA